MKKPYIPQPCHEDWNTMTEKEKGRFCDVCAKVVVDFTTMSDEEIIAYFQQHQKQKTCGHFRNDQIIQKQKIYIDIASLPKNISFRNIFIACFMSFFSSLFFISCHQKDANVVGEIAIVDSTQTPTNDDDFVGEVAVDETITGAAPAIIDGKVVPIKEDSTKTETGECSPAPKGKTMGKPTSNTNK